MWFSTEQLADEVTVWQREAMVAIAMARWKGRERRRGEGRDVYGFRDEQ